MGPFRDMYEQKKMWRGVGMVNGIKGQFFELPKAIQNYNTEGI